MTTVLKLFWATLVTVVLSTPVLAEDARMGERVLGKIDAPVKVDEFVSLTCSHCAEFYTNVLPDLEKKYVDTGKVRFVMHDFPLDGLGLKAAAIARCMPVDEYFPFVKTLYASLSTWASNSVNAEASLIQYAKLGGLTEDKAKLCAQDSKLQDEIVAELTDAKTKYQIEATPTFIINDGVETIKGTQSIDIFSAAFDRQLASKK